MPRPGDDSFLAPMLPSAREVDEPQFPRHSPNTLARLHPLHGDLLELGRVLLLRYLQLYFPFQIVEVKPLRLEDEISGEAHDLGTKFAVGAKVFGKRYGYEFRR